MAPLSLKLGHSLGHVKPSRDLLRIARPFKDLLSGKMYTVIWVYFFFTIVLVFKNWTSAFKNSLESVLLASSCPRAMEEHGCERWDTRRCFLSSCRGLSCSEC